MIEDRLRLTQGAPIGFRPTVLGVWFSLVLALSACGPQDDPLEPYVPRQPQYDPPTGVLSALLGDSLSFYVTDTEGRPYPAQFLVDDDFVGTRSSFHYRVERTEEVVIRAKAIMDNESYEARWPVRGVALRYEPVSDEPWILAGKNLRFGVSTSSGHALAAQFFLDGELVSNQVTYVFHPTTTGSHEVRVVSRLGDQPNEHTWTVHVPDLIVSPAQGTIELFPYEPVVVSVARSDGVVSYADWDIDHIRQARAERFEVVAEEHGGTTLEATFDFALGDSTLVWQLVDAAPVPDVELLEVQAPVGSDRVVMTWRALEPGANQSVPSTYLVAQANYDFDPGDWDLVDATIVEHDPGVEFQSATILEFPGDEDRFVRVYARDAAGRVGHATPVVPYHTPDPGASIQVSGALRFLPWTGVPTLAAGVRATVGNTEVLAGADGLFSLGSVFSNGHQFLDLTSGSSSVAIQALRLGPLPSQSVDFPLLLLPEMELPIRLADGTSTTSEIREYLVDLTDADLRVDGDTFHAWPGYPVTVFVHDFAFEGGVDGPVDYAAAFEYAVSAWNTAAGEELVRVERVSEAPTELTPGVGIYYEPDLVPGGSSQLGNTVVVRPPTGRLFQVQPEWVAIHLRNNFIDDWVARAIITHELGHGLYVAHSDDVDDLMYPILLHGRDWTPVVSHREGYVARFVRHAGPGVEVEGYLNPSP